MFIWPSSGFLIWLCNSVVCYLVFEFDCFIVAWVDVAFAVCWILFDLRFVLCLLRLFVSVLCWCLIAFVS